MKKQLLSIFLCISLTADGMYRHTPALYITNKSNQTVTVQVTNPLADKTVSALLNPQRGMFAYAPATIEAIMIHGSIAPGYENLSGSAIYPQLVTQATQQKKNLCIDILSINPLTLSDVYLCSKSISLERSELQKSLTTAIPEQGTPRVLLINNNILWGTISDIKIFENESKKLVGKVESLSPQTIKLLNNISTVHVYYVTMMSPLGIERTFYLSGLDIAQRDSRDVLYEFSTDWNGTIHPTLRSVSKNQADTLINDSHKKPSRFAQLQTAIARLAKRFFRKKAQETAAEK